MAGPRSLWNGTISVGLLAVPVKLHTATESKTVHFSEVHERDGAKIEHRRFCSKEGKEVPYEEVVKGYEVSSGTWVVLEKDEVKAAAGSRGRLIDVEEFVEVSAIDPIFFEKTYYLGAGDEGGDAYRVLHDALEKTGRAAIGRFTFHDRERLVAIRALDGVLALHQMRFDDEVVDGDELDVGKLGKKPSAQESKMADQLLETLHADFDPTEHDDEYRAAVLAMIKRKAKGEEIEPPDEEDPEPSDDLMAALEASLGGGKAKKKKPAAKKKAKAKR
ncbi:MAG TPA: Ku protein [Capillimicrobium sp.]|jgi:DNA end-binding protein Ku